MYFVMGLSEGGKGGGGGGETHIPFSSQNPSRYCTFIFVVMATASY